MWRLGAIPQLGEGTHQHVKTHIASDLLTMPPLKCTRGTPLNPDLAEVSIAAPLWFTAPLQGPRCYFLLMCPLSAKSRSWASPGSF